MSAGAMPLPPPPAGMMRPPPGAGPSPGGQPHGHPHPHPHQHPPQMMGGPPMSIPVNPAMTALLDSLPYESKPFMIVEATVPNTQPPVQNTIVVCPTHKTSYCEACGVDFNSLNYMHQFMRGAPPEAIPPPPNVPAPPQRAEQIKMAKEQGNTAFKAQQFPAAIAQYSRSADMALSRPPWEPSVLSKEEVAIALCNRSAAFAFAGAWSNALADADAVIALKRPWTKGHFRRSRALMGLGRLEDAKQALVDGLQFEPEDKELNALVKEIQEKLDELDE